ncbi:MAG: hypothetical protein PHQ78_00600, partial [Candidatus Cloacimonetes bacterium]|nr:hypothetical protein [Candidatus Cloacimonadota bacterium]
MHSLIKQFNIILMILPFMALSNLWGQNVSPMGYEFEHPWTYYENFSDNNQSQIYLNLEQWDDKDFELDPFVKYQANDMVLCMTNEWDRTPQNHIIKVSIINSNDEMIYNNSIYQSIWSGIPICLNVGHLLTGDYRLHFSVYNVEGSPVEAGTQGFYVGFDGQYAKINSYGDRLFRLRSSTSQGPKRPMLFIEGFDIFDDKGYTDYVSIVDIIQTENSNALDGIDVYFLDFKNPYRDMRDNAMSVLGVIEYLNTMNSSNKHEGTIVVGFSMGGVLARYALAFAEHHEIQHYCSQLITFDTPHQGAVINENLQSIVFEIYDDLDDKEWVSYIPFCGSIVDKIHKGKAYIKPLIDAFQSVAAKQLIRNNRESPNWQNYDRGSDAYLEFFREINPEARDAYYGTSGPNVMNFDQGQNSNPGFPYKYNSISTTAVSNGGSVTSGDISSQGNSNHEYMTSIAIDGLGTYYCNSENYDTQPGSTMGIEGFLGNPSIGGVTTNIYYDPVFIPTRSSLYLRPESIGGASPYNGGLSMSSSNFGDIDATSLDMEDYLVDHTHFDAVIHNANPNSNDYVCTEHLAIVSDMIPKFVHTFQDIENRATGFISGTVVCTDYSDIQIRASVDNVSLPLTDEYRYVQPDGSWILPYTLCHAADIKVEFIKNGFMPSVRNIPVQYLPTGISYSTSPIYLRPMNLQNILVSKSGNGSFEKINDALDYICDFVGSGLYQGEPISIRVQGGTYEECLNLVPLVVAGVTDFTLEGVGDVTIDGNYHGIGINLDLSGSNIPQQYNADYKVINVNVTKYGSGIVFVSEAWDEYCSQYIADIKLSISGCDVSHCNSLYSGANDYSAGAIHFEGAGSISSCNIHENYGYAASEQSQSPHAGGIYINNDSSSIAEVSCNVFIDNTGNQSGGIVAHGSGQIRINGNRFNGNTCLGQTNLSVYEANALSVYDASDIVINNNRFIDNIPDLTPYGPVVGLMTYATQSASPISFINNTIVNTPPFNVNGLSALKFRIQAGVSVQDVFIQNNVFSTTNNNGCTIDSDSGYYPVSIDHNIIHNTSLSGFSVNFTDPDEPRFNYQCDPKLDSNYKPIWNSTTISPCIDAGIGEYDDDGTPPDIGAIRAIDHSYWKYSFENQHDVDRWHWVSYPILNTITDNALIASEFFKELLVTHPHNVNGIPVFTPTYLDSIKWVNRYQYSIYWEENSNVWSDLVDDHIVSSPQGYKINMQSRLDPSFTWPVTLKESGLKTPDTTPFPIYEGVENWVGYFKEESAKPEEAFESIWDDLVMVKGKNWSIQR